MRTFRRSRKRAVPDLPDDQVPELVEDDPPAIPNNEIPEPCEEEPPSAVSEDLSASTPPEQSRCERTTLDQYTPLSGRNAHAHAGR